MTPEQPPEKPPTWTAERAIALQSDALASAAEKLEGLEWLVDDYLTKHDACVKAGHAWELAKQADGDGSLAAERALEAFTRAHNARARAFKALRNARRVEPTNMWDELLTQRST